MELQNIPQDFTQGLKILQDHLPLILAISSRIVSAFLVLVAGWVAGNWAQRRIMGIHRLDATLSGFLGTFVKYGILAVSLITVLGQFGVQTASLLAVLGAAGLAIGLAMQGTLSNVAAGAMMLILRPFNVGDYIQVGGIAGTVRSLGIFGTELTTPDNIFIFVPNGKIWGTEIFNYTHFPVRRSEIKVGIGYGDDIGHALAIVKDVLSGDARVLQDAGRLPEVQVAGLGDFSVNLTIQFWSKRGDMGALRSDMLRMIKEGFDRGGISIPFPTRTLEIRDGQSAPSASPASDA